MEVDGPKVKKSKKSKTTEGDAADGETKEGSKEVPKEAISAIAKPLAGKKVAKSVLKLVKKGQFCFARSVTVVKGTGRDGEWSRRQ